MYAFLIPEGILKSIFVSPLNGFGIFWDNSNLELSFWMSIILSAPSHAQASTVSILATNVAIISDWVFISAWRDSKTGDKSTDTEFSISISKTFPESIADVKSCASVPIPSCKLDKSLVFPFEIAKVVPVKETVCASVLSK